jgi:hypothetical protein
MKVPVNIVVFIEQLLKSCRYGSDAVTARRKPTKIFTAAIISKLGETEPSVCSSVQTSSPPTRPKRFLITPVSGSCALNAHCCAFVPPGKGNEHFARPVDGRL